MSDHSLNTLNSVTPEKWKRPEDVMKMHRLRMKKKALQARMNKSENISVNSSLPITTVDSAVTKRKNPFSSGQTIECKLKKGRPVELVDDSSNDSTLFKLFNLSGPRRDDDPLNFTNILSRISGPTSSPVGSATSQPASQLKEGKSEPPVDWTLRTKVRFISQKPFPWSTTLRTCEEASGITGFARCIDSNRESTLDTSPNAQFHQCCLVWQHPSLPWLEMYPRQTTRAGGHVGGATPPPIVTAHPTIRDSLHHHWADSFRSLYQLLRARQCPYFYFVSNTFTCLFRAAGVCGIPHTHVLITPTTRGFRKTLRDQEIEFSMPLRPVETESEDTGYETLDATESPELRAASGVRVDDEGEDGEEAEAWLQSMGVDSAEIKRISSNQAETELGKERRVDRTPESLVLVEDTEAHVLFNMLLNLKSSVATTGPLAGVPPTLLAPVTFLGASLRALKVKESKVQVGRESYYSMEVRGPVLPTTVQQLCDLLRSSVDQFSFTLASQESTKAFTQVTHHYSTVSMLKTDKENTDKGSTAFCQEGLSDCGQPTTILRRFCSTDAKSLQQFDSLKFSDNVYSLS